MFSCTFCSTASGRLDRSPLGSGEPAPLAAPLAASSPPASEAASAASARPMSTYSRANLRKSARTTGSRRILCSAFSASSSLSRLERIRAGASGVKPSGAGAVSGTRPGPYWPRTKRSEGTYLGASGGSRVLQEASTPISWRVSAFERSSTSGSGGRRITAATSSVPSTMRSVELSVTTLVKQVASRR